MWKRIQPRLLNRRQMSTGSSLLLFDPFDVRNAQKIRETAEQFAKPSVISFDAFGTIYTPSQSVGKQYHDIAKNEFGIHKTVEEIDSDFAISVVEAEKKYPNYGKGTLPNYDAWWKEVIVEVFGLEHYNVSQDSDRFCVRLLDHFTLAEAYHLYSDVVPTLTKLQENGVKCVASTNSDPRVITILQNLGLGQFFDSSNVFLSYDLGVSKPDKQFFDLVYLKLRIPGPRSKVLEKAWHVGDSMLHDFVGSVKAGWNGVLLDRNHSSEFFQRKNKAKQQVDACFAHQPQQSKDSDDLLLIANNRVVVSSLSQLLQIYELD